jgi:hypothetical protein
MSTDPITEPPKPGKGKPAGKLAAWVKTHRNQAILGGGSVVAVGIALWRRRSANSSAAAAPAAGVAVPADATSAQTAGGVGFTPNDGSFDPMQQVVDLQSSINTLSNSDAAAAAAAQARLTALGTVNRKQSAQLKRLLARKAAAKKKPAPAPKKKRTPRRSNPHSIQGANPPRRFTPPRKRR